MLTVNNNYFATYQTTNKRKSGYYSNVKTNSNSYFDYAENNSKINFAGINLSKILKNERRLINLEKELPPIESFSEYKEVLEEIINSRTVSNEIFWRPNADMAKNQNIKQEHIGLLPYCGVNDVSWDINRYLGGRINYDNLPEKYYKKGSYVPTHESIKNIIRGLEYSLKQLDENFGKYKGFVFRKGYMSEYSGQYVSSSTHPEIAANFNGFNSNCQYSIIETKNGHKIHSFQEEIKNNYEKTEREILLPRQTKYEKISPENYDDKIQSVINIFALELSIASKLSDREAINPISFNKAAKLITVFKEI